MTSVTSVTAKKLLLYLNCIVISKNASVSGEHVAFSEKKTLVLSLLMNNLSILIHIQSFSCSLILRLLNIGTSECWNLMTSL